jgi:HSP20 family protein
MAINRWDPFTVLARVDDDFEGLVRRTWGNAVTRTAGYVPAIDMVSDGTDVIVTLELPGLDIAKDVEIEVHEGRLTISGQRQDAALSETSRTLVRELRYGSFRRDFALPDNVSAEDISADYDKGLLTVRVKNVTKPVEEPHKIEIKGSSVIKAVTQEESVTQAA